MPTGGSLFTAGTRLSFWINHNKQGVPGQDFEKIKQMSNERIQTNEIEIVYMEIPVSAQNGISLNANLINGNKSLLFYFELNGLTSEKNINYAMFRKILSTFKFTK